MYTIRPISNLEQTMENVVALDIIIHYIEIKHGFHNNGILYGLCRFTARHIVDTLKIPHIHVSDVPIN